MLTTIIGLIVVGFFVWGFYKDGIFKKLEHKELKNLTVSDFGDLLLHVGLIILFLKLLFDLF